jgi:hypothetical protein
VTAAEIRQGVESLVQRGRTAVTSQSLPLTPRSQHVIELARDEARSVSHRLVETEHLLLGLLREPDGVAGHVLCELGVKPDELRAEALKTRISLMKIVERCVRPVRCGIARKRKMREELFTHVTGIYDEELERLGDPDAAIAQTAGRFGEPAALAHEIESSLPSHERFNAFVERWTTHRSSESATRYSLRMTIHTFYVIAAVLGLVTAGIFLRYGWIDAVQTMARVFAAVLLLTPPLQFVVGLALIKMRAAMWGAFGNRKSWGRVLVYYFAIAAVAELYLMSVAAVARLELIAGLDAARLGGAIGVLSALVVVLIAYLTGPATIRDARWAQLDIDIA